MGEVKGVARVYDKGKNTSQKKGKHFCGTKALFEEGLDADPTWVRPRGCCPNFELPPLIIQVYWQLFDPTAPPEVQFIVSVHFMAPALQDAADLLVKHSGRWNGLFRLHLYTEASNVGPDMSPADFVDLGVTGYAPIDLGVLIPSFFSFNSLGFSPKDTVDTTFHVDSTGGGERILGAWIERTSDGSVVWQGEYLFPIELPDGPFDVPTGIEFFVQSNSDT